MKDNISKPSNSISDILAKVKKLEKDYVNEMNDSKSEGQKKKKKMKETRKDIARLKTKLSEILYEKVSNE